MRIRKNDTVLVIAGKDRGKRAKVRQAFPRQERLLVEGVNMVKRHLKAGRTTARQAGVVEGEALIPLSNVMLICTKCHQPTRVGSRMLEDGTRVRLCRRCKEVID